MIKTWSQKGIFRLYSLFFPHYTSVYQNYKENNKYYHQQLRTKVECECVILNRLQYFSFRFLNYQLGTHRFKDVLIDKFYSFLPLWILKNLLSFRN